jgi:hypothetical protein
MTRRSSPRLAARRLAGFGLTAITCVTALWIDRAGAQEPCVVHLTPSVPLSAVVGEEIAETFVDRGAGPGAVTGTIDWGDGTTDPYRIGRNAHVYQRTGDFQVVVTTQGRLGDVTCANTLEVVLFHVSTREELLSQLMPVATAGEFFPVDVDENAVEATSGIGGDTDDAEIDDSEVSGRDWADLQEILSFAIDLAPGVGTVKALYEIIDGRDPVTGTQLSDFDRVVSALALVLSVVGFGWLAKTGKFAKVGPKIQRLASKYLWPKPARTTRYGPAHKGQMNIGGPDPPKVRETPKAPDPDPAKLPDGSPDLRTQERTLQENAQRAVLDEKGMEKQLEKEWAEDDAHREQLERWQRGEGLDEGV